MLVLKSFGHFDKDSDFMPHFWGANPLEFMVHVCPHCGFVGIDEDFERIMDSQGDTPFEAKISGYEKYKRLAERYLRENRFLDAAVAFHRAAWCLRLLCVSREVQIPYLKKAIEYFKKALELGEVPEEPKAIIAYLIGELHRICGNFNESILWFDKASKMKMTKDLKKWLPQLIERQKKFAEMKDASIKSL